MAYHGFRCRTCGYLQTFERIDVKTIASYVKENAYSCRCLRQSFKTHEMVEENSVVMMNSPSEAHQNLLDWEEMEGGR